MELRKSDVMYNKLKEIHDKIAMFLKQSENYVIEFLYKNMNGFVISHGHIPSDGREDKSTEKELIFHWEQDYACEGSITIPYNEVLGCYSEKDEWGQNEVSIVTNGLIISLSCCGIRG